MSSAAPSPTIRGSRAVPPQAPKRPSETPLSANVAAGVALLRDLDVAGDYPGFVLDEVLGRELAATI
ncbi:MAG: hypothetical protein ACOCPZ_00195, partial [Natrialbaceae archaeon]